MTEHLELDDILELVSEAGYYGKINHPVSFISIKPIFHAEEDLGIEEEFWPWKL